MSAMRQTGIRMYAAATALRGFASIWLLNATQASYENDSFDNKYDEGVPYPLAGVDANGTGNVIYDGA